MLIDYEGAPVFDCIYKDEYYEVKSVDEHEIVSLERKCNVIGAQSKIQTEKVKFNVLKEQNDHIMMVLKKGKI